MRPFRFFFALFYVTLIFLLSPVFLHLSKYLIGIVVSADEIATCFATLGFFDKKFIIIVIDKDSIRLLHCHV